MQKALSVIGVAVGVAVWTNVAYAQVRMAEPPVARGRVWAVLDERDLVPEGTAYDPATRAVLVGSLNKRAIVAIAEDGTASDRVRRGDGGLASVAGIHVDAARGVLWATSNARYDDPSDTTTSALFAFEAATGRLLARHDAPPGASNFLNDITTAPDGTVYMTDSRAAVVWVLPPGATGLQRLEGVQVGGPNGITVSDDGRHLFISDRDHVLVVPLEGGIPWRLQVPDTFSLAGIDGLAWADGALIAHHPLALWRVARYPLDAGRRTVLGRELIEAGTPDARTSTTGEVVGDEYVYIGNGQLDRMNAGTLDSATMDPVRMYRAPLRLRTGDVVLVAQSAVDSVTWLDAHTLERIAALPTGRAPHEIAVARDGRRAYVADASDSSITVLEVHTPEVAGAWRLPDGIGVHDIAVPATGSTLWAVSGARNVALEIDTRDGSVRRRLTLERDGGWMVEPDGRQGGAIVAHLEGGAVTRIAPDGTQHVLPASAGEIDAALSPDGRHVWSVNLTAGSVTVRAADDGRIVDRDMAGAGAGRVRFTPDGRTALVVASDASTLVAYDVAPFRRAASLTLAGGPKVIALSDDGRRAYITHPERNLLTVVDVPSMSILTTVRVPGTPDGVAFAPGQGGG